MHPTQPAARTRAAKAERSSRRSTVRIASKTATRRIATAAVWTVRGIANGKEVRRRWRLQDRQLRHGAMPSDLRAPTTKRTATRRTSTAAFPRHRAALRAATATAASSTKAATAASASPESARFTRVATIRRNGDETDVDCGGDDCDPCDVGAECDGTGDCAQPPDPDDEGFRQLMKDNVCVITCGPSSGTATTKWRIAARRTC